MSEAYDAMFDEAMDASYDWADESDRLDTPPPAQDMNELFKSMWATTFTTTWGSTSPLSSIGVANYFTQSDPDSGTYLGLTRNNDTPAWRSQRFMPPNTFTLDVHDSILMEVETHDSDPQR